MVEVTIDITKSVEENAAVYYDQAKKLKKKIKGAEEIIGKTKERIVKLEKKVAKEKKEKEAEKPKVEVKREWYEKFRWFYSSEGLLVIGGRDATTNEIIIKKHTDKDDLVFHTNISGSPFFVVKSEGKPIGDASIEEAAQATAVFSRAWKLGLASLDVFYVMPSQVSKEAEAGEYMPKGSFMVRGKKTTLHAEVRCAVGVKEGKIISGPVNAVKKHAENYLVILQGKDKPSDIAKKIRKKLDAGTPDEIIRMLPSGGCELG